MNNEKGKTWRHWTVVGLAALLAMGLLISLAGCERPKRSKSSGVPTSAPGATATATLSAEVSTSPTTVSAAEETPTSGLEAPSPTAPSEATPTLTPAPTDTPPSPGTIDYIIKSGDTLYSIAKRYNVTVDAIMAINGLTDPGALVVGQTLKIPSQQEAPTPPASDEEIVHIVQRGEWLYQIAREYGTTAQAIANRNGIVNPSLIRPGQRLIIPGGGETPPPSGETHVVQRGENLFRIALRYGTTVQAIMQANSLASTIIYPGQQLRIP